MVAVGVLGRSSLRPGRGSLGIIALAGAGDMGANILFLLATRSGLLIITAVLVALYPAVTVLLARAHLRSEEHTSELQSLMRISYAVFCLKKKTNNHQLRTRTH